MKKLIDKINLWLGGESEVTQYKVSEVAMLVLGYTAIIVAVCGHYHHIFTAAFMFLFAYILDRLDKKERNK